jgi:hypothetical protein
VPFVLNFGGDDFPYLMNGFLERAPEASTRWIGAIAPDPIKAACTLGNAYFRLGALERDNGHIEAALDCFGRAQRAFYEK